MSYLIAVPESLATAVADTARIEALLGTANTSARASTTAVVAAAEDEVSTAIATVFSHQAQQFHALSAQASAFHSQFTQNLNSAGSAYAAAEAANASPLAAMVSGAQSLAVFSPFAAATGRPLIGNGANGTTINGVGTAGAPGGWLYGNGGNGGTAPTPGPPAEQAGTPDYSAAPAAPAVPGARHRARWTVVPAATAAAPGCSAAPAAPAESAAPLRSLAAGPAPAVTAGTG